MLLHSVTAFAQLVFWLVLLLLPYILLNFVQYTIDIHDGFLLTLPSHYSCKVVRRFLFNKMTHSKKGCPVSVRMSGGRSQAKHLPTSVGSLCCLPTNAPTQNYLAQDRKEHWSCRKCNAGVRAYVECAANPPEGCFPSGA